MKFLRKLRRKRQQGPQGPMVNGYEWKHLEFDTQADGLEADEYICQAFSFIYVCEEESRSDYWYNVCENIQNNRNRIINKYLESLMDRNEEKNDEFIASIRAADYASRHRG